MRAAADAELELAFAKGGDDALAAVYARYGRVVYPWPGAPSDRRVAEEVTQDVFVAAWSSRDRYDPGRGSLAGWLIGVAPTRSGRTRSQSGWRPALSGPAPVAGGTTATPPEVDQLAERPMVADGLAALRPEVREVVELAYYPT